MQTLDVRVKMSKPVISQQDRYLLCLMVIKQIMKNGGIDVQTLSQQGQSQESPAIATL
jgi:hypothetical protein